MLRVWDRGLEAGEPAWRGVEVVEGLLGDDRRDLASVPTALDRLVHDEQTVRLADRGEHRVAIQWNEAADIDDLRLDAVGRELLGRLEREQDLARPGHDRELGTGAL